MGRRIKSAKGEMVDFDILSIKAQIAAGKVVKTEEPAVVVKRQDKFIDERVKRRIKKVPEPVNMEPLIDISASSTTKNTKIKE
jgi:exonuclease I